MKKEVNYAVKISDPYEEDTFQWIGNKEEYDTWLRDGSLKHGDEIYEVKLIGKIVEKKELELIKTK